VLADLAAVHAGGLATTFYATLAPEQIAFVAGDCDARIAVLNGAGELARWQPVLAQLPGLKTIIVRDAAACPAGEPYLTWDDFAALGKERYAADPDLVSGRVAAITIDKPGGPAPTPREPRATRRACCSPTTTSATSWPARRTWA